MNFFKKFRDFVTQPTHKRTLGFLGILTFVGIISLTVVVAQQQQQTRQRAAEFDYAQCGEGLGHWPLRCLAATELTSCDLPNRKCLSETDFGDAAQKYPDGKSLVCCPSKGYSTKNDVCELVPDSGTNKTEGYGYFTNSTCTQPELPPPCGEGHACDGLRLDGSCTSSDKPKKCLSDTGFSGASRIEGKWLACCSVPYAPPTPTPTPNFTTLCVESCLNGFSKVDPNNPNKKTICTNSCTGNLNSTPTPTPTPTASRTPAATAKTDLNSCLTFCAFSEGDETKCNQDCYANDDKIAAPPTSISTPTPTSVPGAPTNTPIPLALAPTNTPTPAAAAAPVPTATHTPTPTPAPGSYLLTLSIKADGIGKEPGENSKPNRRNNRQVTVTVKYPDRESIVKTDKILSYSTATGLFTGVINMGTGLPNGIAAESIEIKMDTMRGFVSNKILTQGANTLSSLAVRTGLNEDNNIDAVTYYEILRSCFNGRSSCKNLQEADVNDDGKADGIDHNFFIKSIKFIQDRET